jgi:hypothetical protein
MNRLAFVALAVALAACASAQLKPPTIAPSVASAQCPLYIIDGVVQPSPCATSKKAEPAKCDDKGPLYVVDGVVVGCVRPEAGR